MMDKFFVTFFERGWQIWKNKLADIVYIENKKKYIEVQYDDVQNG